MCKLVALIRCGVVGLWFFIGIVAQDSLGASPVGGREPSKEAFDWAEEKYFTTAAPTTVALAVIVYRAFAVRDGEMVHLDPKLGSDVAHKELPVWLGYKPMLATSDLALKVRDEILARSSSALTKAGFTVHAKVMDKPQTVRGFLEEFAGNDVLFLVVCLEEPEARLLTLTGGSQSAVAQTGTDIVLLTRDFTAVAGRSRLCLPALPTVGKLERDYDAANLLQSKVEFRFTTKAFLEAIVPQVTSQVERPFGESLQTMQQKLEFRVWSSTDGRKVEAAFVSVEDGIVSVRRRSDGQTFSVPLARLSEDDRKWVAGRSSSEARDRRQPQRQTSACTGVADPVGIKWMRHWRRPGDAGRSAW